MHIIPPLNQLRQRFLSGNTVPVERTHVDVVFLNLLQQEIEQHLERRTSGHEQAQRSLHIQQWFDRIRGRTIHAESERFVITREDKAALFNLLGMINLLQTPIPSALDHIQRRNNG